MEPHKNTPDGIDKPKLEDGPIEYFKKAFSFANEFYGDEIARIGSVEFNRVTPEFFFREYIWVVHATGFSAKAVSKFMPRLIVAYGDWAILGQFRPDEAIEKVRGVCNNPAKIKAIWSMARSMEIVARGDITWEEFRHRILSSPEKLAELPYIGKITCYHLGRNIGLLECVKPDLHLVRMAKYWGFSDCVSMCEKMRDEVDPSLPLGIVDLVLWYAASTFGTLSIKKEGDR